MQHETDSERNARDLASGGAAEEHRLRPLGELPDYDVAEGDPDIRGWKVTTADGACVGCVHELIVDTVAMEVRYADVVLDLAPGEAEPHVLLPLGVLRLTEGTSRVRVERLDAGRVAALPRWSGSTVDDAYERTLCALIAGDAPAGDATLFDTREFWGHWRAGRAGTAFLVEMGRLHRGRSRNPRRRGDRRAS